MHQSFPDFTFVSGEIIGKFFKLKGEIDPNEAIDISNHASLAFLQKHLSKYLLIHVMLWYKHVTPFFITTIYYKLNLNLLFTTSKSQKSLSRKNADLNETLENVTSII